MMSSFLTDPPSVTAVIATRGRPELLRDAVRAVLEQAYRGRIDVIVVFDQTPLDDLDDVVVEDVLVGGERSLRTVVNTRTPGLAGARNTGILVANTELVAFCDDDDEWMPTKISRQVAAWRADPDAVIVATGIRIDTAGTVVDRVPPERTELAHLLVSRVTELHPSSFLIRRLDLVERIGIVDRIGLVDEALPASYGEDYDLLLRAAKLGHVLAVAEPLVLVHWNRVSFFAGRWRGIVDGLSYLVAKHPEFATTPVGSARLEGQIAFALAALGQHREARAWARKAIGHDHTQLRGYAALVISAGLVPAGFLVAAVNRRGRGL